MTCGAGRPRASDPASGSAPAQPTDRDRGGRFRTTVVRVLLVQVVTLALLWLLQAAYHG